MTTICAYVQNGRVILGSDQQRTYEKTALHCGPKWRCVGPRAAAVTGSSRVATLLWEQSKDLLSAPVMNEGDKQTPVVFLERLIDLMSLRSRKKIEAIGSFLDADILYIDNGRMWLIVSDGSITELSGFWAAGAGRDLALGAWKGMCSLVGPRGDILNDMVRIAVEAAIEFDTSSGGEPWVEELTSQG